MEKRELIRQAAVAVIAQQGFHEATIQKIANEAGVAVGTIYNYFRTKEEILGHIFQVECERRVRLLQGLIADKATKRAKFSKFLAVHFGELRQNPSLARVLLQENGFPTKPALEPIKGYASSIPQLLDQLLSSEGQARSLVGTAAFGAIQALTMRWLTAVEGREGSEERYPGRPEMETLVDLFCGSD